MIRKTSLLMALLLSAVLVGFDPQPRSAIAQTFEEDCSLPAYPLNNPFNPLDVHFSRVANLSAEPLGELTPLSPVYQPRGGEGIEPEDLRTFNNIEVGIFEEWLYRDKAGVIWRLQSPQKSKFHQPAVSMWIRETENPIYKSPRGRADLYPNRKFLSNPNAAGQSLEFVYEPSGASNDNPGWRVSMNSLLLGTFNYADSAVRHAFLDVVPHEGTRFWRDQGVLRSRPGSSYQPLEPNLIITATDAEAAQAPNPPFDNGPFRDRWSRYARNIDDLRFRLELGVIYRLKQVSDRGELTYRFENAANPFDDWDVPSDVLPIFLRYAAFVGIECGGTPIDPDSGEGDSPGEEPPADDQRVGRSYGDPHQLSFDRLRYSFQAAGEFILVNSSIDDFEVQARQDFTGTRARSASLVAELAVRTPDNDIVQITNDRVFVNGQAVSGTVALRGGATLTGRVLTLADGSEVRTRPRGPFMDVTILLSESRNDQVVGTLGNSNGDASDDLSVRDGSQVINPDDLGTAAGRGQLYDVFGPSWVPGLSERILTGDPSPYIAPEPVSISDFGGQERQVAIDACEANGWTASNGLAECVFDLLLTGDLAATDPSGQFELPSDVVNAGNAATIPDQEPLLPNPNRTPTSDGRFLDLEITQPSNNSTVADDPVVITGLAGIGGTNPDASVVYVLDVSSSTNQLGVDCNGDGVIDDGDNPNRDSRQGSVLDCEIAGLLALNDSLVGGGASIDASLVLLASSSAVADLSPLEGFQPNTQPSSDLNGNGIRDVDEVLTSARSGGAELFTNVTLFDGTNFDTALEQVADVVADRPQGQDAFVYFLSDGEGNVSSAARSAIEALSVDGVVVNTYSVGSGGAGCEADSSMRLIADGTFGVCTDVQDASELRAVLTRPSEGIASVTVTIDNEGPVVADLNPLGQWSVPIGSISPGPRVVRATVEAVDGTTVAAEILINVDP